MDGLVVGWMDGGIDGWLGQQMIEQFMACVAGNILNSNERKLSWLQKKRKIWRGGSGKWRRKRSRVCREICPLLIQNLHSQSHTVCWILIKCMDVVWEFWWWQADLFHHSDQTRIRQMLDAQQKLEDEHRLKMEELERREREKEELESKIREEERAKEELVRFNCLYCIISLSIFYTKRGEGGVRNRNLGRGFGWLYETLTLFKTQKCKLCNPV